MKQIVAGIYKANLDPVREWIIEETECANREAALAKFKKMPKWLLSRIAYDSYMNFIGGHIKVREVKTV